LAGVWPHPNYSQNFLHLGYLIDLPQNIKLFHKAECFLWRTTALGCSFAGEGACSPFSVSSFWVDNYMHFRAKRPHSSANWSFIEAEIAGAVQEPPRHSSDRPANVGAIRA
jgi:hypothetical protein